MPDREEIVIVGAGGHGRTVLDAIQSAGKTVKGFLDRALAPDADVDGVPVLGDDSLLEDNAFLSRYLLFCGLGDIRRWERLVGTLNSAQVEFASVVHASAALSPRARIGAGTLINTGASVNTGARIGTHCIVNTSASIDHDCDLADFVHVGPGAVLSGGVFCGHGASIGAGAVVLQGVRIGKGARVAAGGVVTKNVADGDLVMGVPARSAGEPPPGH